MGASVVVFVLSLLLFFAVRFLRLASQPEAPTLYYKKDANGCPSNFVRRLFESCPMFMETYTPPLIWGRSGHLQTIVHSTLGRTKAPMRKGDIRHSVVLADGATMTFDIFEPTQVHLTRGDYTVLVCPGIGNSSQTVAIQTFGHHLTEQGYRVAVLNHLGAIKTIPLTAPRIFTFGSTEEFHTMAQEVKRLHPDTQLIAVGFSMGANLVVKYLGEKLEHQHQFLCGVSACQGYSLNGGIDGLLSWNNLRKAYMMIMTHHQKRIIRSFRQQLFGSEAQRKYGPVDEARALESRTLNELDESFTRKMSGFSSLHAFYEWCSSSNYINNIVIPMLVINAVDDPLIPEHLLEIPTDYAEKHDKAVCLLTKHGGHLGFFESQGGLAQDTFTWLDRVIAQYANTVTGFVLASTAVTVKSSSAVSVGPP